MFDNFGVIPLLVTEGDSPCKILSTVAFMACHE